MGNLSSGKRGEAEVGSPHMQWRRSARQRFQEHNKQNSRAAEHSHKTHRSGAQTQNAGQPSREAETAEQQGGGPRSRRTQPQNTPQRSARSRMQDRRIRALLRLTDATDRDGRLPPNDTRGEIGGSTAKGNCRAQRNRSKAGARTPWEPEEYRDQTPEELSKKARLLFLPPPLCRERRKCGGYERRAAASGGNQGREQRSRRALTGRRRSLFERSAVSNVFRSRSGSVAGRPRR